MAFIPVPRYPQAIDSDYTLYLVHNTTEAQIAVDNSAWSQEIEIVPVAADENEIWPDNGFANIDGELLYYDAVGKDVNGKVYKLRRCSRQLSGTTKFNNKGTWIRGFVVAEHHNQLVNAIIKTENFIGYNYDTRQETLDWRIRNLASLQSIYDDYNCPDVIFDFNLVENDPETGILYSYSVKITDPGNVESFRLDFGDGQYTTTELEGFHRYAVNTKIDPVITISNGLCETVQTAIERTDPNQPETETRPIFDVPVPEIPDIPDFTFVPCSVPEADISLPPLVFPCISLAGQLVNIPSIISGPYINMVSHVVIEGPNEPVQILHSQVTITGDGINIPSIIFVDMPNTIVIDPPIPPTIVLVPPASVLSLELDASNLPRLEVDWGAPPPMEVALTLAKNVSNPQRLVADPEIVKEFGTEFADLFEASDSLKVEYESVGIPEEIRIIPPEFPSIKIESNLPQKIKIDSSDVQMPDKIKIYGPDSPIPNSIRLEGYEIPDTIDLVYSGSAIPIDTSQVPKEIKLVMEKDIPNHIVVEMPVPIPSTISIEHTIPEKIILEGPQSIPLSLPDNFALPVVFPDKMPEVELVWRGSPIEVKITMDEILSKDAAGQKCVVISPCPTG
jgi:hypothetical protein